MSFFLFWNMYMNLVILFPVSWSQVYMNTTYLKGLQNNWIPKSS